MYQSIFFDFQVDLSPTTQRDLLRLFLSCLSTVSAPTELLYAAAALAQAGTTDTESHVSLLIHCLRLVVCDLALGTM